VDLVWYRLRQSRSAPPGLATSSQERRLTYSGALGQFEELMKASKQVTPATRPLPLYYALSQAGKAIAAALVANGVKPGHGLRARVDGTVVDTSVSPKKQPEEYQAVADAVGSRALPPETPLGALWASLVDLLRTDMPDEKWMRPLHVESLVDTGFGRRSASSGVVAVVHAPVAPNDRDDVESFLRWYPTADEAVILDRDDLSSDEKSLFAREPSIVLRWDAGGSNHKAREKRLDEVAPLESPSGGRRYLRPRLPGGDAPSTLMTWWALLYGFSILARYHPALWSESLRVDASQLAIPIEDLLEEASEHLPGLVHEALLGHVPDPFLSHS
jgi:hypothetical protein